MLWLGTFGWLAWIGSFLVMEAYGFRKANDHWPTFSQLVKEWEGYARTPVGYEQRVGGLSTWTWRRWLVACGLPASAVVLELHWVWQVF